jgi:hypothetical protein
MSAEATSIPEKKRKLKSHTTESHPAKKIKKSSRDKSKKEPHPLQSDGAALSKKSSKISQSSTETAEVIPKKSEHTEKTSKTRVKEVEGKHDRLVVEKPIKKKEKKGKSTNAISVVPGSALSTTAIAVRPSVKEQAVQVPKPSSPLTGSWHISEPIGGQFRSIDPCYSLDER